MTLIQNCYNMCFFDKIDNSRPMIIYASSNFDRIEHNGPMPSYKRSKLADRIHVIYIQREKAKQKEQQRQEVSDKPLSLDATRITTSELENTASNTKVRFLPARRYECMSAWIYIAHSR